MSKHVYTEEAQKTDRIIGAGNRLIEAIEHSSSSQEKHQKSIRWLTIVIAISTVIYTGVTIWSTLLQHQTMKQNQHTQLKNNEQANVSIKD